MLRIHVGVIGRLRVQTYSSARRKPGTEMISNHENEWDKRRTWLVYKCESMVRNTSSKMGSRSGRYIADVF